ncbi:MAG: ABC-F family ATP-binding cassette domain-containing protein [Erysipelotrichaceae bacterium]
MYISAEKITKKINAKTLFQDINFYLKPQDKVGLIGVNGTGKTTFLKVLAKEEVYEGNIMYAKDLKIGFLKQRQSFKPGQSAMDFVLEHVEESKREQAFFEARKTLHRFGVEDVEQTMDHMSGGAKKRVALCAVLVNEFDVLILDEPTNHLDELMIAYLEKYLMRFSGALLMVSHDRYFLDRCVNRIVEIEGCELVNYEGNYPYYLEHKALRLEAKKATERKRISLLKGEAKWMAQGAQGRGTKSKHRIERFEELSRSKADFSEQKVEILTTSERLGRKVMEIEGLGKQLGERVLFHDFSTVLTRHDRIGFVGVNGCGKTTLLHVLAGLQQPSFGHVVLGETVKLGYYHQEEVIPDPSMRCIDYVSEDVLQLETTQGVLSASSLMERFLFDKTMQYQAISTLSGGERRRLYLLKILIQSPNVLILDEPTNDLDLTTLTILESYLDEFNGAVITVSHDRYFLDKVVDRLYVFQEDGTLKQYIGGYSDYALQKQEEVTQKENKAKAYREQKNKDQVRFTSQEAKEFASIDATLEAAELALAQLDEEIDAASDDYELMMQLSEKREQASANLDMINERWLYLYEKDAEIKAQKSGK